MDWENRYQQGQTGWDRGDVSENLLYWLDNELLKPCSILIPGCGNGYEVLELAKRGFDVTAIDIAPSAISNLKAALDKQGFKANCVLADFFDWQPETPFDVIYEQTSLCALPPQEWKQYQGQLSAWLKPTGKIFAQFMQTGQEGGPPFHCAMSDMNDLFSERDWLWSEEYNSHGQEFGDKNELLYILEKKA